MIWLLSDLHGSLDGLNEYLKIKKENDYLIILGDVELYFDGTEKNNAYSNYLTSLDCNIAIVDGNHDNFDYLESLPVIDWHGGKAHKITDKIVHLIRGHIFNIENNSFLVMGGCGSTDKWKNTPTWWKREQASDFELEFAYENLKKHGNQVDYILTHKYTNPAHTYRYDSAEKFAQAIEQKVTYKHWFSGHWHEYLHLDNKHTVIYNKPVPLK